MTYSSCQWLSALGLALVVHIVLLLTIDPTAARSRIPEDEPEFVLSLGGGLVPSEDAEQVKAPDELQNQSIPMTVVEQTAPPPGAQQDDVDAAIAEEAPAAAAPNAAPPVPEAIPEQQLAAVAPQVTQSLPDAPAPRADVPVVAPSLPIAGSASEGDLASGPDVVLPSAPAATAADAPDPETLHSIELAPVTAPGGTRPRVPFEPSAAGKNSPAASTSEVVTETAPEPAAPVTPLQPGNVVVARAVPMHSARDVAKATAEYAILLKSWLQGHMHYPHEARLKGQQGTAVVTVVMTRDGRIKSKKLEQSSGFSTLDKEALEMVRRAAPLPPLPPEMTEMQLAVRIPVRFNIKDYETQRTVPPIQLR